MALDTIDRLLNAMGNSNTPFVVDKASLPGQAANAYCSLWRATGVPGQAVIPTTPAIATSALLGAIPLANATAPAANYLSNLAILAGNTNTTIEIHDRIAHMGGLNGNIATLQTVGLDLSVGGLNPQADRRGASNFSEVTWWLEVYVSLGATASNATINVTFTDATTANLTALAVTSLASGRCINLNTLIGVADQGKIIRAINNVTLSAATGAGNFGFTATRQLATGTGYLPSKAELYDWQSLGLPLIPNNACLSLFAFCSTTSSGTVRLYGKMPVG